MPLLESLLWLVAYAIVAGILFFGLIWVLGLMGITVPERIKQLLGALLVVMVIIWFVAMMHGYGPPFPRL